MDESTRKAPYKYVRHMYVLKVLRVCSNAVYVSVWKHKPDLTQ